MTCPRYITKKKTIKSESTNGFSNVWWSLGEGAPSFRKGWCNHYRNTPHNSHLETPVDDNREQEEGDVDDRRDDGCSLSNPPPNVPIPRSPPAVPPHQARATQHAAKLQEFIQPAQRMRFCGARGGGRGGVLDRRYVLDLMHGRSRMTHLLRALVT